MSKTPIYFKDIRPGDTVERELLGTVLRMPVARIADALAYSPENYCVGNEYDAAWYLLDRPKPPVDLPTEPTLGWLVTYEGEESSGLGIHRTHFNIFEPVQGGITDSAAAGMWPEDCIVSFTPATAVPTKALARFRSKVASSYRVGDREAAHNVRHEAITGLTDAIDEANA